MRPNQEVRGAVAHPNYVTMSISFRRLAA